MTATLPAVDDHAPVAGFSQCHAGILAQLDQLDRLPALLAAATEARAVAGGVQAFFHNVLLAHHADEERELFPAVRESAVAGAEREQVDAAIARLTHEHRCVERAWREIEPALRDSAHGREARLDLLLLSGFVAEYRAHADYEEREFLPLAHRILGRNGNHMAALGASLHARHVLPEVLRRYGTHL